MIWELALEWGDKLTEHVHFYQPRIAQDPKGNWRRAIAPIAPSEIIVGENAEDSLLSSKSPVKRLRGMEGAQGFPSSPTRSNGDDGQVYLSFTSLGHGSRSGGEKLPSTNSQGEISPLIDSGYNSHMTPCRDDLVKIREIEKRCTLGNQGQFQARATGDIAAFL